MEFTTEEVVKGAVPTSGPEVADVQGHDCTSDWKYA
jgi:hypothetical protein